MIQHVIFGTLAESMMILCPHLFLNLLLAFLCFEDQFMLAIVAAIEWEVAAVRGGW